MRGIAIFLVLILHSYGFGVVHMQGLVWQIAQAGWVGVDLFFVLSGFLITRILLKARGRRGYFRVFYARRFLRIFPPYYAAIGLVFLIGLSVRALQNDRFADLLSEQGWLWTFTTNIRMTLQKQPNDFGWYAPGTWYFFTHLWSLAVEEQFYVIWPLLIAMCPPRRLPLVIAALCIAAPVVRCTFIQNDNFAGAYMFTLSRADALAAGAFLAVLETQGRLTAFAPLAKYLVIVLGAAILALGVYRRCYTNSDAWVVTAGYSLNAIFFAGALALTLTRPPEHPWIRFLEWRPLRSLGQYSYSIYICHMMLAQPLIMHFIHHGDDVMARVGSYPAWLTIILVYTLAMSYAVSLISWNLFENRFLALKKYFPYPK